METFKSSKEWKSEATRLGRAYYKLRITDNESEL